MGELTELSKFRDSGDFTSDEAKAMAKRVYNDGLPLHQCYWNDRLGISVMFGLDELLQKQAAERVADNGGWGYYEPVSHFGYDVNKALASRGVPIEMLPERTENFPDYHYLSSEAIESIRKSFDLKRR